MGRFPDSVQMSDGEDDLSPLAWRDRSLVAPTTRALLARIAIGLSPYSVAARWASQPMGPIGVGHCQTIGVGLVSSPKQLSATKGNEPFGRPNRKAGGAHRSVFAFADWSYQWVVPLFLSVFRLGSGILNRASAGYVT